MRIPWNINFIAHSGRHIIFKGWKFPNNNNHNEVYRVV